MTVSLFWKRLVCFLFYLSLVLFVVMVPYQSLQNTDISTSFLIDDLSQDIKNEENFTDIYSIHKEKLAIKTSVSSYQIPSSSQFSYLDGVIESFFVLKNFSEYTNITAELITQSNHAYFFVQANLISAFGRETILNVVSSEKNNFENKIYFNETDIFGSIEGNLGNIGDGKIIVLFANLPSGIAGYFDPNNEYTQDYLNSIGLNDSKSNEWEMIYLDCLSYFDTTLAHEFQHLIHFNHDQYEVRWIDEGLAEFAGFITGTQPSSWNNITPFAQYYFKYHPEDSLLYWNFYSEGGMDVRIDYGGSYLFAFYIFEQYDSSILTFIVNNTLQIVDTINDFFNSSLAFNEIFYNWSKALLLDDTSLADGKYGFLSIDFTIEIKEIIMDEVDKDYNIPYFGVYSYLLDFTKNYFEVSIINRYNRDLSLQLFYLHDEFIESVEHIISSSYNFTIKPNDTSTHILFSLSFINEEGPITNGDFGLGPTTSISLISSNPFKMHTNTPSIIKNQTHISIYELYIMFANDTDIYYCSGYDEVILSIISDEYSFNISLSFDLSRYYGWGGIINIENLIPNSYNVVLFAQSEEYNLVKTIYSFDIDLKVFFAKPILFFNNFSFTFNVSCNITVFPEQFFTELIEQIRVVSYIYNYSEELVTKIQLNFSSNTWSISGNCALFDEGYYYTYIHLYYNNKDYKSFSSELNYYSPITNNPKINKKTLAISTIAGIFLICSLGYYIIRKKIKVNLH